jgi:hypothetical protein
MGVNVDNLFVRSSDPEAVLDHVATLLKRKMAASAAQGGWVHVIAAGEESPPEVAQKLSVLMQCEVVCAQLYEVSGDAGWAAFRNGVQLERSHSESLDDPAGAVADALTRFGIPFRVREFRELVVLKAEGVRTRAPAA